jgi:hypothetical protein
LTVCVNECFRFLEFRWKRSIDLAGFPTRIQALCTSSHLSIHLDLSPPDGPNGAAPVWAGSGSLFAEPTSISRLFLQGSTAQPLLGIERLLERFASGLTDEDPQGNGRASSSAEHVIVQRGVGFGVLSGQGFAHASLQLAVEPTIDDGLVDLTTAATVSTSKSRNRTKDQTGSSPLHILLFVNNKRMDDSGCLSASCACWEAVARAKAWKAAGVSVYLGDAVRSGGAPLCIRAAGQSFRGAWLVLHVRAGSVTFSDHAKTRLRPMKGLPAAINAALAQALAQVGGKRSLSPRPPRLAPSARGTHGRVVYSTLARSHDFLALTCPALYMA